LKHIFEEGKNAVIDSGISEKRLSVLKMIANTYAVQFYMFSLIAPYDVLRLRVKERDQYRDKRFDKNRFDYTFNAQQSKSFENFYLIDSNKLSPQEMCEAVYSRINK